MSSRAEGIWAGAMEMAHVAWMHQVRLDLPALQQIADGTVETKPGWMSPLIRTRTTLEWLFKVKVPEKMEPNTEAALLIEIAQPYLKDSPSM